MNICLIRPSTVLRRLSITVKPSAPLGLAFIAGALKTAGHNVMILDAIAENPDQYTTLKGNIEINGLTHPEILSRIPADTDCIGISIMFTNNWLNDRSLIDYLGANLPHIPIFAGGEHITGMPERCLNQTRHLKVCVLGEGEDTVTELVRHLQSDDQLAAVEGIAYKQKDGEIKINARRKRIREVENIAWPAWELFPLQSYRDHELSYGVVKNELSLPIMATRGCPYECTFCSSPQMWGTRYFMRKPSDVADEIVHFQNLYGATNFDFYDLTAILKRGWIIEFCKELIDRDIKITWQIPAGTRSEAIDQEVAHYLYKTGCRNITYAPESGSVEILKAIKKKVRLPKMLESFYYTQKEGMSIKLNMLIGLPEERHKHIWQTMWFLVQASRAGVHDIFPTVVVPYAGCELFTTLEKEGKINPDSDEYFERIIVSDSFFDGYFYNEHISSLSLRLYRLLYLFIFYTTNFLFRPHRLWGSIRNVIKGTPVSRGEQRLYEVFKRNTLRKDEAGKLHAA
jgi:anaerobic magnesium-protoporphyrin IX monomethyl ester cyclase